MKKSQTFNMIRYYTLILLAYNLINCGLSESQQGELDNGSQPPQNKLAHRVMVNREEGTITIKLANNVTLRSKIKLHMKNGGQYRTPVTLDATNREQEKQRIFVINNVPPQTTSVYPDTTISPTTQFVKPNAFTYTTTNRPTQAGTTTEKYCTTTGAPAEPVDEAVVLFKAGDKLANLTLGEKYSAVVALTVYYDVNPGQFLGPMVTKNLILLMAYTPELLPELAQPTLDAVLSIATENPCLWHSVPRMVRDQFLNHTLSLSPGTLYRVYRPALVTVLGAMASTDATLPRQAVENLVTVMALSRQQLFCALPPAAIRNVLRSVNQHPDLFARLPPSTFTGFLGGLFHGLMDGPSSLQSSRGRVPAQLLAATLVPVLNARLLAVLPAGLYDRLLVTVAKCPKFLDALPPNNLVALFNTLAGAPALITAVKPDHLAEALAVVVNRPSGNLLHPTIVERLLEAMDTYSPRGIECLPENFRGLNK